jgi:hypothetical protein
MSNVIRYDLTVATANKKLAKNFTLGELACPCGCKTVLVDMDMLAIVQSCRDYFGRPVYASPWYRCEAYNAAIGGADNSNHVKGRAGDLEVGAGNQQIDPLIVAMYFECMFGLPGGIGLYIYPDGRSWVHVDNAGVGRYWRQSKAGGPKTYVDSFVPNLRRTLIRTDRVEVRCLQHLLNRLAYRLDEDGWFGSGTQKAVKNFQKTHGLAVDGVAGKDTFTKLFQISGTW